MGLSRAWRVSLLVGGYSPAVPTPRNPIKGFTASQQIIRRVKCRDRCYLHRGSVVAHAPDSRQKRPLPFWDAGGKIHCGLFR
jgi:hypothetical protein